MDKIIIVDNEDQDVEQVKQALENKGFEVAIVSSPPVSHDELAQEAKEIKALMKGPKHQKTFYSKGRW